MSLLSLPVARPPAASRRQLLHAGLTQLRVHFPAAIGYMAELVTVCALCASRRVFAFLTSAVREMQLHPCIGADGSEVSCNGRVQVGAAGRQRMMSPTSC